MDFFIPLKRQHFHSKSIKRNYNECVSSNWNNTSTTHTHTFTNKSNDMSKERIPCYNSSISKSLGMLSFFNIWQKLIKTELDRLCMDITHVCNPNKNDIWKWDEKTKRKRDMSRNEFTYRSIVWLAVVVWFGRASKDIWKEAKTLSFQQWWDGGWVKNEKRFKEWNIQNWLK